MASARRAAADSGTRSRSMRTASRDAVGDMAGIGQQAVGDIGRRARDADQAAAQSRCAAAAGDSASRAPRSRADPAGARASRPSAPSPIVPLTQSSSPARAPARVSPLPRGTLAERGDGDGERPRRDHGVAAAQHDAVAALIGRQPAREARDPALAPALRKRQRQLVGERRGAARREIGQADAQRLGRHQLGLLVGQEMNAATRPCRSSRRGRAAHRPAGRRCRSSGRRRRRSLLASGAK